MFKNLRKIPFRDLFGEKSYTLISILCLKTGIICSLLLLLYIVDELTSDHLINAENYYHIALRVREPDGEYTHSWEQPSLAKAVAARQQQHGVVDFTEDVTHNARFRFDALMSVSAPPMFRLQANWGWLTVKFEGKMPTLIWSSPRYAVAFLIIGLIVFLVGKKRK